LGHPIAFRPFHALAVLATLAPVLALGAALFIRDRELYRHAIKSELRAVIRVAATAIDGDLTEWRSTSLERLALSGLDLDHPARRRQMLDADLADHPATRSLALLGQDGTPGIEVGALSDREIVAVAATVGFLAAFSQPKLRLTGLLQDTSGSRSLIGLAIPLDGAGASERALLAIGRVDQFRMILTASDTRLGMQAAVIDQYGMVMADSDPGPVGQPFPQLQSQTQESGTFIRQISLSDTAFYAAARHTDVSPWRVVCLVPTASLNGASRRFLVDLAVLIGLLIMSLATSGLIGQYLGRRIEALAGAADLVPGKAIPFAP
jgi:hypothetical protein